jgi:hypothetical protein
MSPADLDPPALSTEAMKGNLPVIPFADARTCADRLTTNGATTGGKCCVQCSSNDRRHNTASAQHHPPQTY